MHVFAQFSKFTNWTFQEITRLSFVDRNNPGWHQNQASLGRWQDHQAWEAQGDLGKYALCFSSQRLFRHWVHNNSGAQGPKYAHVQSIDINFTWNKLLLTYQNSCFFLFFGHSGINKKCFIFFYLSPCFSGVTCAFYTDYFGVHVV